MDKLPYAMQQYTSIANVHIILAYELKLHFSENFYKFAQIFAKKSESLLHAEMPPTNSQAAANKNYRLNLEYFGRKCKIRYDIHNEKINDLVMRFCMRCRVSKLYGIYLRDCICPGYLSQSGVLDQSRKCGNGQGLGLSKITDICRGRSRCRGGQFCCLFFSALVVFFSVLLCLRALAVFFSAFLCLRALAVFFSALLYLG